MEEIETTERIFNVFINRKSRGKKMESNYFSLTIPAEEDEHTYIRTHIRNKFPGWLLGGYAPKKPVICAE